MERTLGRTETIPREGRSATTDPLLSSTGSADSKTGGGDARLGRGDSFRPASEPRVRGAPEAWRILAKPPPAAKVAYRARGRFAPLTGANPTSRVRPGASGRPS